MKTSPNLRSNNKQSAFLYRISSHCEIVDKALKPRATVSVDERLVKVLHVVLKTRRVLRA